MLTVLHNNDISYNYIYNVYVNFDMQNSTETFTGKLDNVDESSFWFRIEGAICKVNQENVIAMIPKKIIDASSEEELKEISKNSAKAIKYVMYVGPDIIQFKKGKIYEVVYEDTYMYELKSELSTTQRDLKIHFKDI